MKCLFVLHMIVVKNTLDIFQPGSNITKIQPQTEVITGTVYEFKI